MRLGIDLGGTKIEGIVLDASGNTVTRKRIPAPRHDYDLTLNTLAGLIAELQAQAGASCSIGIGTPGATSPTTNRLRNSNSTWLNGKPLQQDLERLLNQPLRMANDADCFALSEATDGAGAGAASVFGVILGTGIGGGLVIDGRLLAGPNRIAGEWGHNPLPWPEPEEHPGRACYCGQQGCIETWLSGPGLAADHATRHGGERNAADIAAGNNDESQQSMARYVRRLARALASVINVMDPEVIVLGGGLSGIQRLYADVPELWGQWVFSDTVQTRLLPPRHGDASGVRGAAWLWND